MPHPHRLTNPIENEYHLKNGKRFRDFQENKLGEQYHKKDGISTIVKYKILEKKELNKNVINYKIFKEK